MSQSGPKTTTENRAADGAQCEPAAALKAAFTFKDVDRLHEVRDELRLQAHLFRAEVKDRWDDAEVQWHELQKKLEPLRDAASRSSLEVGLTARLLAETLRDAYRDLRKAMPR